VRPGAWVVVVVALASVATFARTASAADEPAESDPNFEASLDSLTSVVHVPIVTVGTAPDGSATRTTEDAKVFVRNVTAAVSYRFLEHLRVGLSVPWTSSTIKVGDRVSRGATSFGNTELDLGYEHTPFTDVQLAYGLGFSGVTAEGDDSGANDQASSDQDATNRAVSAAGGRAVNAKFEPHHYAVILGVGLQFHRSAWELEPYLRVTMLRDTTQAPLHRTTLQDELGARVARRIGKFAPGLRTFVDWVPVGLTDGDRNVALAVVPEGRGYFGPFTVVLGVVVPVIVPRGGPAIVAGELGLVLDL
jgi:hypothetical protein